MRKFSWIQCGMRWLFFCADKHQRFLQAGTTFFCRYGRHAQIANQIAEFLEQLYLKKGLHAYPLFLHV